MKILFYDAKTYDKTSFDEALHNFPDLEVDYTKTDLDSRTAALADGFDAVCGFVSSDIGAQTPTRPITGISTRQTCPLSTGSSACGT